MGSAFFMAGQTDGIVSSSSVEADFDDADDVPAAFGELAGAGHFEPTGDGGGLRGAATAWAHWQLMGDTNGRGLFVGSNCALCTSSAWSDYQANDLLQGLQPPGPDPRPGPRPPSASLRPTRSTRTQGGPSSSSSTRTSWGSGDFLGFPSTTSSLHATSPGFWEEVANC